MGKSWSTRPEFESKSSQKRKKKLRVVLDNFGTLTMQSYPMHCTTCEAIVLTEVQRRSILLKVRKHGGNIKNEM